MVPSTWCAPPSWARLTVDSDSLGTAEQSCPELAPLLLDHPFYLALLSLLLSTTFSLLSSVPSRFLPRNHVVVGTNGARSRSRRNAFTTAGRVLDLLGGNGSQKVPLDRQASPSSRSSPRTLLTKQKSRQLGLPHSSVHLALLGLSNIDLASQSSGCKKYVERRH
ncbi:hypothetical protein AAT19DRAFT_12415 [Rhodotorula toruloides]|uniref:Uncharacterized protein n=1 Tax=Rhodotorula toruloides TaxID=5286 RepID=A0A2T0AG72_RHOTO|nr:hypothetical protein AAT19DRAFT_12415 [Rhodotorula toruloides]